MEPIDIDHPDVTPDPERQGGLAITMEHAGMLLSIPQDRLPLTLAGRRFEGVVYSVDYSRALIYVQPLSSEEPPAA